jgi:hypothetical protein
MCFAVAVVVVGVVAIAVFLVAVLLSNASCSIKDQGLGGRVGY